MARDFAETAELAHPALVVEVVEAIRVLQDMRPDGVDIHVLVQHAKARGWSSTDRRVLTRRCRTVIGRGLLVNLETRRGQPARYRLSAGACEDVELFPSALDLERSLDRWTTTGPATGSTQSIDEQGGFAALNRSTSESGGTAEEIII